MGVCILVRTFKSEYYDLPTKYDKTTVKLLVQSPTRMYTYWDVSDKTIKEFSSNNHDNYNNCIPFLRITNLSMNYSYEIQVDPFANNYYIDVKDTDCDYKVELIRKENGKTFFVALQGILSTRGAQNRQRNVWQPLCKKSETSPFLWGRLFALFLCIFPRCCAIVITK